MRKQKRTTIFDKINQALLYITNNEKKPKDEILFDKIFIVVDIIAIIVGIYWLWPAEKGWIPFLVIEFCWALDNLRWNRG